MLYFVVATPCPCANITGGSNTNLMGDIKILLKVVENNRQKIYDDMPDYKFIPTAL
jgi:hypothetical protein